MSFRHKILTSLLIVVTAILFVSCKTTNTSQNTSVDTNILSNNDSTNKINSKAVVTKSIAEALDFIEEIVNSKDKYLFIKESKYYNKEYTEIMNLQKYNEGSLLRSLIEYKNLGYYIERVDYFPVKYINKYDQMYSIRYFQNLGPEIAKNIVNVLNVYTQTNGEISDMEHNSGALIFIFYQDKDGDFYLDGCAYQYVGL